MMMRLEPTHQSCKANGRSRLDMARELLLRCRPAFAVDAKNPSVTTAATFGVDTGEAAPIRQGQRRFSSTEQKFVEQTVKDMLNRDQIERSTSAWAANSVLVKQNDKVRFCLDYRDFNKVTKKDSYGLDNKDDML